MNATDKTYSYDDARRQVGYLKNNGYPNARAKHNRLPKHGWIVVLNDKK